MSFKFKFLKIYFLSVLKVNKRKKKIKLRILKIIMKNKILKKLNANANFIIETFSIHQLSHVNDPSFNFSSAAYQIIIVTAISTHGL